MGKYRNPGNIIRLMILFWNMLNENNIIERNLTRQIFRCYQTKLLPNIEVTNTTRLSSDIVYKYKVIDICRRDQKN